MSSSSKQKTLRSGTRIPGHKGDGVPIISSIFKALCSGISLTRVLCGVFVVALLISGIWMLPLDKILKRFLIWLKQDVGIWGPVIMALAYIPLTILAVPASILTIGGGYVFGLTVGFVADSLGSTAGATAAFIVGKTIGRSYVTAKLKDFPQFQAISGAIAKSGFKIVLLLRLVPLVPFNIMNYLLSVTPISVASFTLASWIGMMPITFLFVYIGTTIKDISEIGDSKFDANEWWMVGGGMLITGIVLVLITRTAKDILQKALDEHETNKEDDKQDDEERALFRREVTEPKLSGVGVFKPILRMDVDVRKS